MRFVAVIALGLAGCFYAMLAQADPNYGSGRLTPCITAEKAKDFAMGPAGGLSDWGVEVAGGFDRKKAMDDFKETQESHGTLLGSAQPVAVATCALNLGTNLFYSIRLPADSREDADELCTKLKNGGVPCIVRKN